MAARPRPHGTHVPIFPTESIDARLEIPLEAYDEAAVAGWLDDRLVDFAYAYLELHLTKHQPPEVFRRLHARTRGEDLLLHQRRDASGVREATRIDPISDDRGRGRAALDSWAVRSWSTDRHSLASDRRRRLIEPRSAILGAGTRRA
jgi:hypothetical protein